MPSNHLDDACQSRGDSAAKCAHTNSKGDECTHKINDNQFFSLLSSKILLYLHNKWMHSYRYGPSIISFVVVLFFFFVRILLICDTNDICLELWSAKWDSTEARRVYTFFILYTEYNHTPFTKYVCEVYKKWSRKFSEFISERCVLNVRLRCRLIRLNLVSVERIRKFSNIKIYRIVVLSCPNSISAHGLVRWHWTDMLYWATNQATKYDHGLCCGMSTTYWFIRCMLAGYCNQA